MAAKEYEPTIELLQSVQLQANKFFTGMQMASNLPYSSEDARNDLDGLTKLTDTLYEKLQASGLNAIPLDSETQQLDCQTTLRKGHEDSENCKITMQRVQMNCSAINKTMAVPLSKK